MESNEEIDVIEGEEIKANNPFHTSPFSPRIKDEIKDKRRKNNEKYSATSLSTKLLSISMTSNFFFSIGIE